MSMALKVLNEKTIKEKLDINYVMVIKGFLITYSLRYPEGRENKEEKEGEKYYAQMYSSTFFRCERVFWYLRETNQCDR